MDPELYASIFGSSMFGGAPALPPVGPGALPQTPAAPTGFGTPKPIEPYMTSPMSVGAALDPQFPNGAPMPQPRPQAEDNTDLINNITQGIAGDQAAVQAMGSKPAAAANGSDLLKTLRGVTPPQAPAPQKVTTPHLPNLSHIQGGGLVNMLSGLGIGPAQAFPGLKLPSTLGAALGGR